MLEKFNLQALVFDGYGTLFNLESALPAFEEVAPNRGLEVLHWWRAKQLSYTRQCILTRHYRNLRVLMEQSLKDTCLHFKLKISLEKQQKLCEEYFKLKVFDEVPEVLLKLKEKYKLVILSHGTQDMLETVAKHNSITHLFDEILSVDIVQAYKPDLKAYELLTQKFVLPEKSFGYLGVNPMDIAGAKAFGMKTIWVRRAMPTHPIMNLLVDINISNLLPLI